MLRAAGDASEQHRFYYGWVVVATGFVLMTVAFGIQYSFGVFFKPLQDAFGWSRGATSMVATLHTVVFGLSIIPIAWVMERVGTRRVYSAAAVFVGVALVLCSRVTEQWQLYLVYGLPAAIGLSIIAPTTIGLIPRWFTKHRGIALGITSAGTGFGTLVGAPLSNALIDSYGWRSAFAILGIGGFLIILICAYFMRRPPDMLPDHHYAKTAGGAAAGTARPASIPLRQAFRTRELWLILLAHGVSTFAIRMNIVHIAPYARDIGISTSMAALAVGTIGGASIVGRLGMGLVQDRIGPKASLTICLLIQGAAMVALPWLTSEAGFFMYAIVFGLAYGGDIPQIPAISAQIFGVASMGTVWGFVAMEGNIAGAIGPAVAGFTFDAAGSYMAVFVGTAICLLASALWFTRLRTSLTSPAAPRRGAA